MIAGQRLAEYRDGRGVTPSAVADVMDVPRQRVYQIERAATVELGTANSFVQAVESLAAAREGRPARKVAFRVELYLDGERFEW